MFRIDIGDVNLITVRKSYWWSRGAFKVRSFIHPRALRARGLKGPLASRHYWPLDQAPGPLPLILFQNEKKVEG